MANIKYRTPSIESLASLYYGIDPADDDSIDRIRQEVQADYEALTGIDKNTPELYQSLADVFGVNPSDLVNVLPEWFTYVDTMFGGEYSLHKSTKSTDDWSYDGLANYFGVSSPEELNTASKEAIQRFMDESDPEGLAEAKEFFGVPNATTENLCRMIQVLVEEALADYEDMNAMQARSIQPNKSTKSASQYDIATLLPEYDQYCTDRGFDPYNGMHSGDTVIVDEVNGSQAFISGTGQYADVVDDCPVTMLQTTGSILTDGRPKSRSIQPNSIKGLATAAELGSAWSIDPTDNEAMIARLEQANSDAEMDADPSLYQLFNVAEDGSTDAVDNLQNAIQDMIFWYQNNPGTSAVMSRKSIYDEAADYGFDQNYLDQAVEQGVGADPENPTEALAKLQQALNVVNNYGTPENNFEILGWFAPFEIDGPSNSADDPEYFEEAVANLENAIQDLIYFYKDMIVSSTDDTESSATMSRKASNIPGFDISWQDLASSLNIEYNPHVPEFWQQIIDFVDGHVSDLQQGTDATDFDSIIGTGSSTSSSGDAINAWQVIASAAEDQLASINAGDISATMSNKQRIPKYLDYTKMRKDMQEMVLAIGLKKSSSMPTRFKIVTWDALKTAKLAQYSSRHKKIVLTAKGMQAFKQLIKKPVQTRSTTKAITKPKPKPKARKNYSDSIVLVRQFFNLQNPLAVEDKLSHIALWVEENNHDLTDYVDTCSLLGLQNTELEQNVDILVAMADEASNMQDQLASDNAAQSRKTQAKKEQNITTPHALQLLGMNPSEQAPEDATSALNAIHDSIIQLNTDTLLLYIEWANNLGIDPAEPAQVAMALGDLATQILNGE